MLAEDEARLTHSAASIKGRSQKSSCVATSSTYPPRSPAAARATLVASPAPVSRVLSTRCGHTSSDVGEGIDIELKPSQRVVSSSQQKMKLFGCRVSCAHSLGVFLRITWCKTLSYVRGGTGDYTSSYQLGRAFQVTRSFNEGGQRRH